MLNSYFRNIDSRLPLYAKSLCLFCLLLVVFQSLHAQKENKLNLEDKEDFTAFALLDSVVQDHNVFFVGENHNFKKSNVGLQLKMFRYLHKQAGVRTIVFEAGIARGWLVNRYVQTGDSSILETLERYSFNYYAELYKGLREFNLDLPENEKINVVGLDVERSLPTSIKVLSMLLPKGPIPESIVVDVEAIVGLALSYDEQTQKQENSGEQDSYYYDSYTSIDPERSFDSIIERFDSLSKDYKAFLKDDYDLFEKVVKETQIGQQWYEDKENLLIQADYIREAYMFSRIKELKEQQPDLKLFGQFGRCHTTLQRVDRNWCDWYNFNALASRIQHSEIEGLNDKVLTIGVFYPQSNINYPDLSFDDELSTDISKLLDEKDGLYLYEISEISDSKDLPNLFDFGIVNNNKMNDERDIKEIVNNDFPSYQKSGRGITFAGISRSIHSVNYDELNQYFSSINIEGIGMPIFSTGGFITMYNNRGPDVTLDFHLFDNFSAAVNDSVGLDLNAYQIGLTVGSDITRSLKFDLVPAIGFNISAIKMELSGKTDFDESLNLFDASAPLIYRNPSFNCHISFKGRVHFSFLSLALKGGYQFDFSDGKWKANSEKISNSPVSKLSGFFGKLELGIKLISR